MVRLLTYIYHKKSTEGRWKTPYMDGMWCVFTPVSWWNKTTLTWPPYLSSGRKIQDLPQFTSQIPQLRHQDAGRKKPEVWSMKSPEFKNWMSTTNIRKNTMMCSLFFLSHMYVIYIYIWYICMNIYIFMYTCVNVILTIYTNGWLPPQNLCNLQHSDCLLGHICRSS